MPSSPAAMAPLQRRPVKQDDSRREAAPAGLEDTGWTSAQIELDRSARNEPRERSIQSSRSPQSIGTTSITVSAAGAATAGRSAGGSASMTTTSPDEDRSR